MRLTWIYCLFYLLSISVIAKDCERLSSRCIDATPFKNISGVNIPVQAVGGCWDRQDNYQCRSSELVSDCELLRKRGCVQIGSTCIDHTPSGQCSMHEQKYDCPDKPATSTERTVCDESTFCLDGGAGCFDTSSDPDRDFGIAAVMMEAAREAGVYGIDPNKVEIFKGYMETCGIKVAGGKEIKSCCDSSSGGAAFSNYKMMGGSLATGAAGAVGKELVATGSKYVFDALYASVDSEIMKQGLAALGAGATDAAAQAATNVAADAAVSTAAGTAASTATTAAAGAAAGTTFGAYGFTFSYSFANGFSFVSFDPYTLALQIAIMLIQKWMECDPKEQNMSMKKGLNLCAHIGSYCHKKVLGVCIEKKERHCCFNSKLAKVINRQGRAQLGLPMDVCTGFNQEQLQAIDFTKIDFTEFIEDILPKDLDTTAMVNNANTRVNQYQDQDKYHDIVKGYYD